MNSPLQPQGNASLTPASVNHIQRLREKVEKIETRYLTNLLAAAIQKFPETSWGIYREMKPDGNGYIARIEPNAPAIAESEFTDPGNSESSALAIAGRDKKTISDYAAKYRRQAQWDVSQRILRPDAVYVDVGFDKDGLVSVRYALDITRNCLPDSLDLKAPALSPSDGQQAALPPGVD